MKNFLIEFFRPLDNLIFNYLVRKGFVKPILGGLLGAAKGFLGSKVGGSIAGSLGSSLISGITGRRRSKRAERRARALLQQAYDQLRDPSDIISQAYTSGMYSPGVMGTILGREKELIPQFQELAEMRARGIRGIQEESKLRQLGLLGALGGVSRELLEDPRLAELAEMDIAEAERLGTEAAAPLSGERAREAEQTALQMAVRQGRGRGQGAIAQTVLGRTAAKTALEEQAAQARQRALQSATAAQVDPSQFLFTPSIEEKIFIGAGLGPQVTDPGQAINLGSARDVQRANILIGKGALASQAAAARGDLGGQGASALGNLLGNLDFSGFGSRGTQTPMSTGYGTVLAPPSGGFPTAQSAGQNLLKSFGF